MAKHKKAHRRHKRYHGYVATALGGFFDAKMESGDLLIGAAVGIAATEGIRKLVSMQKAKLATDAGAVGMTFGLDPHVLAARLRSVH